MSTKKKKNGQVTASNFKNRQSKPLYTLTSRAVISKQHKLLLCSLNEQ